MLNSKKEQSPEKEGWASFETGNQANTSKEAEKTKNRYDLISDAFAEILDAPYLA